MEQRYPAIYRDQYGEVKTFIVNRFNEKDSDGNDLFMEIDGVKFSGTSFDDFSLIDREKYTPQQLERFCFSEYVIINSGKKHWELCNCEIEYQTPLTLIEKINLKKITTALKVHIILGKPKANCALDNFEAHFTLNLDDEELKTSAGWYEGAFLNLQKQLKEKYHFKNCFGCLFSDYHPVGNGFFGSLMCFKKQKEVYLTVTDKDSFWPVIEQGYIQTQETYCCNEFEMRLGDIGYRGGIY